MRSTLPDTFYQRISVAVARPLPYTLDYLVHNDDNPQIACRVLVPLGKQQIVGLILAIQTDAQETHNDAHKLKPIIRIIDDYPLFDQALLDLLRWAHRYYYARIGDVIFTAIPVALRKTQMISQQTYWRLTEAGKAVDLTSLKRAKKQQQILAYLQEKSAIHEDDCAELFGKTWRTHLRTLQDKTWIKSESLSPFAQISHTTFASTSAADFSHEIALTNEQKTCLEQIQQGYENKQYKPILLHGITGSGKTEVYLRALEKIITANLQALVLIPEIGLTQQLIQRFQHHFPQQTIVVINSGMNKTARLNAWIAAKTGKAAIVIGTRSAVFTPLQQLGMIIIDEEHDLSFKQQDGFRYHARDLAIKRAHDSKIPILLGSATPSLESLYNATIEKYAYLRLSQRPKHRKTPELTLHDTRGKTLTAGLSSVLLSEIKTELARGKQCMVFLNRRGFSPALFCTQCGWRAYCQACDKPMTYHALAQKAVCHHCDYSFTVDQHCPDCHQTSLSTQGQGTERIAFALQNQFPDVPVIRIDRDTTRKKGEIEAKLDEVRQGSACILVGTQMLAKGHDFPNITLVGILDVDQALFSIDYRAPERLAQLITQVAGRAGRGADSGRVMLQTCQPDHPALQTLLSHGYRAFAEQLLEERQRWHFPPYSYQALIRAEALAMDAALQFLGQIRELLSEFDLQLLGPVPAPLERRATWYRAQLLITATQRKNLHYALSHRLQSFNKLTKAAKLRWSIDIDPVDLS